MTLVFLIDVSGCFTPVAEFRATAALHAVPVGIIVKFLAVVSLPDTRAVLRMRDFCSTCDRIVDVVNCAEVFG